MVISYKLRTFIFVILIAPAIYFASFYLLSYYIGGDQIDYHKLYNALYGAHIIEIRDIGRQYVGSSEPISIFILWLGSNLQIGKDVYLSWLNVALYLALFVLCRKNRVGWLVLLLVATNFYMVVLMTGAERLKIAFIFVFLFAVLSGTPRWFFAAAAPLAHFQTILMFAIAGFGLSENAIKQFLFGLQLRKNALFFGFLIILFGGAIFYYFGDTIFYKSRVYFEKSDGLQELFNVTILAVISLYVTRNRFRMTLILIPSYIAIAAFGGSRVNMIAFFLATYYLMLEKRLNHPLYLLLLFYFSVKTIPYIWRVIQYGDGFS